MSFFLLIYIDFPRNSLYFINCVVRNGCFCFLLFQTAANVLNLLNYLILMLIEKHKESRCFLVNKEGIPLSHSQQMK